MKTYYCLFLLYVFITGCSSAKISPIDLNTVPVRVIYSELQFTEMNPDGQKLNYEYPGYAVVKKYADEINASLSIRDNSPYIEILLSTKGHSRYAAYPNYEFQGTDLMVNVFCKNLNNINKEELKTRIIELLMPLSNKLGIKDAKLRHIY